MGIELALRRSFKRLDGLAAAWRAAAKAYARPIQPSDDQRIDAVLQRAYEHAWQRAAIARLAEQPAEAAADTRKAVQAAFCIDVRSEVIRRALESVSDQVETIGFAGFFGFAVDYLPIGAKQSGARCPVLLKPAVHIHETVKHADASELAEHHGMVMMRKRAGSAWASFKRAAVSSFAFVETMGLAYAKNLAVNALGLAKPDGAAHACSHDHLAPDMAGMSPDARLATAEGVLKAMSLTDGFARLVVLAGHGASTVNNPHASGLDCGACGGHSGEANARIAANVLNDRCVRAGLAANGITIPEDTWFLAALHDTTTDKIGLFDLDDVPSSHKGDLKRLKRWLKQAGQRARGERAALLHDRAGNLPSRARDWSQVRPEWGLAGCAGFIAAPRAHTQGRNLEGRCFLHSYDWQQDEGFGVLELIMTAPMVVASWISLQYYGSSVDNRAFGAGNKVLHNVVGALGVLEGQGGDLRTGLPWQSVHDGDKLVHEPMRLSVMIAAPSEAMSAIIAKHDAVRALLDHGWLHLFALDDHGQVSQRYAGDLTWQPVAAAATAAPVEPLAA